MRKLLLTATALSLISVGAMAAGTPVPPQFATQLNGAILNGSKNAPANAATLLKNRGIVVEGAANNAGAASGGQAGQNGTGQNGNKAVAPRLLVATPGTGAASGGVAPTNGAPVGGAGQGTNTGSKAFVTSVATGQGVGAGGLAPTNGNPNIGGNPNNGGNKNAQFLITTPAQGAGTGGLAPNNGGFPGNGNGGQFGANQGGVQALPVVVGPQGAPGGGAGPNSPAGNGNFGQPNPGQFGGQQVAGNFTGGDARFVPAGGNFQPQAPTFGGGNQARLTRVASGAELYQRVVGQGYWAVAILAANTSLFQLLAVDNEHPDYAFLVMVEIDYGRIVNVRPIPLAGRGQSNPQPTYSNPHGTYTAQATPAPNYYQPTSTYPSQQGYGQASYSPRY
ncbi:MAG: hypothetical protein U1E56_02445 [Bauldia sp.]